MAKIGLTNFRFAVLTEASDGTPSYGTIKTPAKAVSCNVSVTNNDAKLYADDALAESDSSFNSGTVTVGMDDDNLEMESILLGHTYTAATQSAPATMECNANDIAPYVGWGRVVSKMVGGVRKYKVEFLYKVKFAEPSQDDQTKGENLEFRTPELQGTIAALKNGKWRKAGIYDSLSAAITALEALFTPSTPSGD